MMNSNLIILASLLFSLTAFSQSSEFINPAGTTVQERFTPPPGYYRNPLKTNTFGHFLRNFPLENHGAKVYYHNGKEKQNQVWEAVLKIDIGKRDLQQCADAVIRLRAEYLFDQKRYDELHFNFTNGFRAEYRKWAEGYRIVVNGNKVTWKKSTTTDYSYPTFRKYLDVVFAYAGTLSLSKELTSIPYPELEVGDVFIQGGSPGHAVIILDVATNQQGQKVYLLAQSYMPAQSIHLLKNPMNTLLSPWYELNNNPVIETPEWNFSPQHLKRFN